MRAARRIEEARAEGQARPGAREWVAQGFTRVEDVVYVGLGLLLAAGALGLLVDTALAAGRAVTSGDLPARVVDLLDRILLVMMIVEVLYTVQVSFREHALVPEPFLIVGLIAATRRLLVLTAEFPKLAEAGDAAFRYAMVELGLLTAMILALVAAIVMLRKRAPDAVAERS
ncbi:MAG: phosphate-starvation-inducible PsiE family protein [Candidatus Rokuibacteriota bacterium]